VSKRLIVAFAVVYTIAAIFVSIFIIKPPKPIIEIKGEPLIVISENSNEMLTVAITNTLLTAWIATGLLIIICLIATRKRSMIPSGFYNLFEAIIELIYNFVTGIAGEKNGRRFFPLVATLLIYITFANWLSLTPIFNTIGMYVPLHEEESEFHEHALVFNDSSGINLINPGADFVDVHAEDPETHEPCAAGHEGDECRHAAIEHAQEEYIHSDDEKLGVLFPYLRGINTDLMTPLAFAIVSVVLIQVWGFQSLGVIGYGKKFFNPTSPINFFVGILEFIAEIARVVSFTFRLFGNMLAGEILLLVMTFLVAVASPILVVFYGLELFVGAIQAFVFGALTLVFAVGAVSHHDGDDSHGHSEEEAAHH
jgi:F-type H+-transporting ATPase subunit a